MKYLWLLIIPSFLIGHSIPFSEIIDFLPVQDGNIWVYSASSPSSENYFFIQVHKKDNSYYISNYFFSDEDFEIIKKDTQVFLSTEKEKFLLYDFEDGSIWHIPEGISVETPCIAGSFLGVTESNFEFSAVAGIFNNCIRILWDNPCKDAGIIEEVFAPNVGLIKRVENRIFGTFSYELVYANINGMTYGNASVSLNIGASPEFIFEKNLINIELKNNTNKELNLTFPTTQIFDIILENEQGEEVYKWSSGQQFLQVLTGRRVMPYSSLNLSVLVSFPKLEKGMYYLKVLILASQINSIPIKKPLTTTITIYNP
jgi:hypothetical protein